MDIFDVFAKITLDSSGYDEGVDRATDRGKSLASSIGSGLKTAAKVGAAALTAVGSAVSALSVAAIKSFADYEQLIGGVETLYGNKYATVKEYAKAIGVTEEEAAQTWEQMQAREQAVLDNAAQAYKTAGMGANEYMETVSGFAASLTSSLGEYQWQAADYADMIITDMSDNANKMGTDIEMIKNAYAGFAKGNFTMLDNLKLGYGGTKEEMERLLRRAEELAGYTKGAFDENSFADVAEAINIIQTELGITGTTAKEAASTISGSMAMAKSAISNLVTGLADENADMELLIDNALESVDIALDNLLPRIDQTLDGIVRLIDKAAPKLAPRIVSLVKRLIPVAVNGLTAMAGALAAQAPDLIRTLGDAVSEAAPGLLDASGDIIMQLFMGMTQALPMLLSLAADFIVDFGEKLIENADQLIDAAVELIEALAQGFIDNFPRIMEVAVDLIIKFAEKMTEPDMLSELIDTAITVLTTLAFGLIDNIGKLLEKAPEIIVALVDALLKEDNLSKIVDAAIGVLVALATGMAENLDKLVGAATEAAKKIADTILDYDWGSVGKKILQSIADFGHHFGLPTVMTNEELTAYSENPDAYEYDYYTGHLEPKKKSSGSKSGNIIGRATSSINNTFNIYGSDPKSTARSVDDNLRFTADRRRAAFD